MLTLSLSSTGEKVHGCPDMISFGAREHHCDYRTHDPAALSKHRKKVHGYIPPPNRSRPKAAPAAPRKTRQKKDEKISRRPRPPQRPASASRRKPSRVPRKTQIPRSRLGLTSTLADPTPFVPLEGVDGDVMDVDCYEDFGYDSSGATLVGSDDEMGLDTLFDPSLCSQWMAKFEMAYSTFDLTGLKYQPEPVPSSDPTCLDVRAGQQGCLCPEWMVEAGIEGWDQSVLESHQEYYVIDA